MRNAITSQVPVPTRSYLLPFPSRFSIPSYVSFSRRQTIYNPRQIHVCVREITRRIPFCTRIICVRTCPIGSFCLDSFPPFTPRVVRLVSMQSCSAMGLNCPRTAPRPILASSSLLLLLLSLSSLRLSLLLFPASTASRTFAFLPSASSSVRRTLLTLLPILAL